MNGKMLIYMNPRSNLQDIQVACSLAVAGEYQAICVPQWFVATAADELRGSNVKVATILGLPGGTTSSFAKYAEAKQAISNGATLLILPVNMRMCAADQIAEAKNDLSATMVAAKKGAEALALLDAAVLSEEQLAAAAEMCIGAKVKSILVANATDSSLARLAEKHIPACAFGNSEVAACTAVGN